MVQYVGLVFLLVCSPYRKSLNLKYLSPVGKYMVSERNRYSISQYPDVVQDSKLIGITAEGLAAYHDSDRVFFAELGENGVKTPPEGYGPAHDIDLVAFEWTVGEYIVNSAMDDGRWRELSEYGKHHLMQVGQNELGIVE